MMTWRSSDKVGRNDPCPCGSGKKYKRCCLQQQAVAESLWSQQRAASDELTRDMMEFAARKFGEQVDDAWHDFNMTDLPVAFVDRSSEDQIFIPYFLFDWDPGGRTERRSAPGSGGVVTQWYRLEKGGHLSELERLFLEEATTQPSSFYEVLWSKPGERMAVQDILIGQECEVIERSASRLLRRGDITYAQIWNLPGLSILGRCAPQCIPPGRKADILALRKKLHKRIARKNRDLAATDLLRHSDEIRVTYLNIRDALYAPPRLCNTDGDPLVFHTLTYRLESSDAALEALAPLAMGRRMEDLLSDAEFDRAGKLHRVEFDWLKKGNRKIASWDNTILGHITISAHRLIAEVNSESRAGRLRAEITRRLGATATLQSTVEQTPEELLKSSAKPKLAEAQLDDDEVLRDPELRSRLQEMVQKQVEAWTHQKIPALGNRTPMQAVADPDGKEIVESLLLDWERHAEDGAYQPGIRPDFNVVRKLLNLPPAKL